MEQFAKILLLTGLVSLGLILAIDAHGRMLKPPNRSSIWRVPAFAHLNPPANYDDNSLYCGGTHQVANPGDNCGVCGDSASTSRPRPNEVGGTYDKGIIVGNYTSGSVIDIEVELTVAHLGAMEFRLCNNHQNENQACFNQNVLRIDSGPGSGTTKLIPVQTTGMYRTRLRLPSGLTCNRCVMQWNYRAGNTWGDCGNGTQASGCGPQETFRGCADVRIR